MLGQFALKCVAFHAIDTVMVVSAAAEPFVR